MKKKFLNIILIILIDQIIKNQIIIKGNSELIENIISFTYTENTGGAFSIGEGHVNVLIIVNILVIGVIIALAYANKQWDFFTCLILAGGISNLLDRITRGFVVDYIDITKIIKFPIFNLADIFIVVGTIFFIIQIILKERGKSEKI